MVSKLRRGISIVVTASLLLSSFLWAAPAQPVIASDTPNPTSVTVAGSLQDELGCPGDWQPECASTHLEYNAEDDVWQGTFAPPEGTYEYKAALNGGWDENYGAGAAPGGSNISLAVAAGASVKFYYDHETHWITDTVNSSIVTFPGSFQSDLGCAGDWDPACLRSWLEDPDGNGVFTFETTELPAGSYEGKAALAESWDVNYGEGGAPGGANIPFTVPAPHSTVLFSFDSATHVPSVTVTPPAGHFPDNNVEWDGLRHDSRDLLYRTPDGAVPAGTPVILRMRTFHNDVTGVTARIYDVNQSAQRFEPMTLAASDVSCYQEGLEAETCDFWALELANTEPNNLWYRFIITDGSDTNYYADNTSALDGGLGAVTDTVVDNSFALMVYDPGFSTPAWARNAVIYQIFPDRFRNGKQNNDPETGMERYDDPAIALDWGVLPEGYCRNYADANENCVWRFDDTPPDGSTKEAPRGRDYYGGDLKGVTDKLDYLKSLGVTVIYFNPIFTAKSNHRYDTANYLQIDPNLGTMQDFVKLVKEAKKRGIRIVLDGVYNHMSSDSAYFDRYLHYDDVGACESSTSSWRDWFVFRAPAGNEPSPCAPTESGGADTYYEGWFGFDSIPVINKSNAEVQTFFLDSSNSVARVWLRGGAAGWRMDVMGDASFPAGYWEDFRAVVKDEKSDAIIIGELWQKDSTLLRFLRGDRADTTMNYRLRDATIGLLTPGAFDSKGCGDSGRVLAPSEFASRLLSIREDYPDAAYYSLMNLLDSHDTERLRWTLTPGAETTAEKEQNSANVNEGLQRMKLASLIQFTMPGSPTVYYGDEVGMTGDDDPDDRRTFPWPDTGGTMNLDVLRHYQALSLMRKVHPVLASGDLRFLLADDAAETLAYARTQGNLAVLVAINRSGAEQTLTIPTAGFLPDRTWLLGVYGVNASAGTRARVSEGSVSLTLAPLSGLVLTGVADLTPTAAPRGLQVTSEGDGAVSLSWNAVRGAAGYNVYRSPLTGGGFVKANDALLTGVSFTDSGLDNGRTYFYIVRAVDPAGNESAPSSEVTALPHLSIGWANTQWPTTLTHTISVSDRTENVYGQVWIDGVTDQPGPAPTLQAQLGYGPLGSDPAVDSTWVWVDAAFNTNAGNNDEFMASLLPEVVGEFDYLYRYSTTSGRDWLYADLSGPVSGAPSNPGKLSVVSSGDVTPPDVPTGLAVLTATSAGVELGWDALTGDSTLYGYEVLRAVMSGGPYQRLARVTETYYNDTSVVQDETYYYVVLALDTSFNRSGYSGEVSAKAETRTVSVVFNVTVPTPVEDGVGRSVYIAGTLNRLDGGLPEWNPGGVVLTPVSDTLWTITLTGKEYTQIEYKYTLGSWDFVEKDNVCGEIGNRQLTLTYGASGTMTVNDTVPNWRNVDPCGN